MEYPARSRRATLGRRSLGGQRQRRCTSCCCRRGARAASVPFRRPARVQPAGRTSLFRRLPSGLSLLPSGLLSSPLASFSAARGKSWLASSLPGPRSSESGWGWLPCPPAPPAGLSTRRDGGDLACHTLVLATSRPLVIAQPPPVLVRVQHRSLKGRDALPEPRPERGIPAFQSR